MSKSTYTQALLWSQQNQSAMLFHQLSTEDYIASRCCILNRFLPQGYILAEQAIEKELKAIILFNNPNINFKNKKLFGLHNLELLLKYVNDNLYANLQIFESLAIDLTEKYDLLRYPDPKIQVQSFQIYSSKLVEIDHMFYKMNEQIQIPELNKSRTGIFPILFSDWSVGTPQRTWALQNNMPFLTNLERLRTEYIKARTT